MDVKIRVMTCRLLEKMQKDDILAKKLGIQNVSHYNTSITREKE